MDASDLRRPTNSARGRLTCSPPFEGLVCVLSFCYLLETRMLFGRKNLKFFLSLCLRIQKEALWRFALLLSIGDGNAVWLKNSKKIFAAMVQLHISGELLSQHLKKLVPAIGIGATRNPQFSRDLTFAFSLHNSLTDELVFRLKPSD